MSRTDPSRRRVLSALAGLGASLGLAGCQEELASQSFVATPVGLTPAGRAYFNLPDAGYEEMNETRTAPEGLGEVSVTSHVVVYDRPREHELPVSFSTSDPTARTVGVLSTPRAAVGGQSVNPLARQSLGELVAGDAGRRLLARTNFVDSPDFEWERGPEQVGSRDAELMDSGTTIEGYFGVIAEEEGPGTAVLMNLARIENDEDVVLMGEFQGRSGVSETLGGDDCVDLNCQLRRRRFERLQDRLAEVTPEFEECPPFVQRQTGREMCPADGGGGGDGGDTDDGNEAPPVEDRVHVDVTNARIVQEVEDTVVVNPNTGSTAYTPPEPDLVEGEDTAVVFELTGFRNLGRLTDPLEIEITHGSPYAVSQPTESFELSPSAVRAIEGGEHTISVLHRAANDNDPDNDNPVFRLSANPSISVHVAPWQLVMGGFEMADRADQSNITDLRELRVGFIGVKDPGDGSNYGTSQGTPRAFTRSVNSAVEYVQRAFPGEVVAYAHQDHWVKGTQSVYKDFKRAKTALDKMAASSSYPSNGNGFPGGGRLYNDTQFSDATIESDIRSHGFDVTVAVVPADDSSNSGATGYFDWHDKNWAGVYTGKSRAVAFVGANPSTQDRFSSTVAAQEIGHYLQDDYRTPSGHPMAQRDDDGSDTQVNNVPVDSAHARHQNSDLRDRDTDGDGNVDVNNPPDPPGVISTGYDLEDGFANVQSFTLRNGTFSANGPTSGAGSIGQVPSYMSYHWDQTRMWADARIHQDMIDLNRNWQNQAGSGSAGAMLTASASLSEEGDARFEDVQAYRGFERFADHEEGPVRVALVDPGGETLQRVRVPDHIPVSHGDDVPGRSTFTAPFPERCVEVQADYRGATSRMNPIVRSVGDAVGRVPAEAFRDDPETVREDVRAALDTVRELMAEDQYADAAGVMDGEVRPAVAEGIGAHQQGLGAPTGEELLDLVDDMAGRLETVAEG